MFQAPVISDPAMFACVPNYWHSRSICRLLVPIYLNRKRNKMMNEILVEEMNKDKYMNFCSISFSSVLEKEFLLHIFFSFIRK